MATYKVTARSGLRVRSKPNGTIMTAMPYGTTVSGDGKKQGGWYHVKYKGRWGWSYGQYLKTVAEKKKTVASIAAKKKPAKKPRKWMKQFLEDTWLPQYPAQAQEHIYSL